MDDRNKGRSGPTRRNRELGVAAVLAACLSASSSASAQETVYQAAGGTFTLEASTTELHVQLSADANVDDVNADSEALGHRTLQPIAGATERFRIYRLVVDGALRDRVRTTAGAVTGVSAVRPSYKVAEFDVPVVMTGQIVVRCAGAGQIQAVAARHNLVVERQLDWLGEVYVVRLADETATDAVQVAAAVHNDPDVVYAEPTVSGLVRRQQSVINDPLFPAQWHLSNSGGDGGVVDADVDAPEAWEFTQGEDVLVAVLDDAVQVGHEDLAANYSGRGFDAIFGGNDPLPLSPVDGHGTSVTGLICAAGNGIGVRGVAPKAKFMAVSLRFGFLLTDIDIAEAFNFARTNGADVVNNSWGGFIASNLQVDAIRDAAIRGRSGRGMLILFASGNDGGFISAFAAQPQIPEVMAVGALLRNGAPTCYTNFGIQQSVSAPGGGSSFIASCFKLDIVTTDMLGNDGFNSGNAPFLIGFPFPVFRPLPDELENRNYTNAFSGTSAACPLATGVAALALSVNPGLTRTQLRNLIEHTATKSDAFRTDFDVVTGHNIRHGHGRVNARAAVEAAQNVRLWPSPVREVGVVTSSTDFVSLFWVNPPGESDTQVLVVRARGQLNWAPQDLVDYAIGDEVAPGTVVVEKASVDRFQENVTFTGPVEYGFFVRNSQGRFSWGRRKSLTVSAPPGVGDLRVTAEADPRVGPSPLTVSFFGGVELGVQPTSFEWRLGDRLLAGDGTVLRQETVRFGRFISHTYSEPGAYTARLIVKDRSGREGSATVVVTATLANQPPTVTITADPITGFAPLAVTFSAGGTDPDGQIRTFLWDFGDDSEGQGRVVDHIYEDPGVYPVTLSVVDNAGATSQATIEIVVNSITGGGTTGVSGASSPPSGSPAPILPSFCGMMGVEALALAVLGVAAALMLRRRNG